MTRSSIHRCATLDVWDRDGANKRRQDDYDWARNSINKTKRRSRYELAPRRRACAFPGGWTIATPTSALAPCISSFPRLWVNGFTLNRQPSHVTHRYASSPSSPLRSRPYMCRLVHAALARTPRWLRFPLCSPVRPATSSVRALKQFGPGAARPHDKICEGRTVIGCRVLLGGMSGTIIGWLGGMQMQADLTRSCGSRATQRGE
jgi:hypothetical protein